MKKIYTLLFVLLNTSPAFSQCPTVDITLTTQLQVDNFSTTYPGCTAPTKSISVGGPGINDLTGLQDIVSIGGSLNIGSTSLANLNGLSNLTTITGDLVLRNNGSMGVLTGLSNVKSIGGKFELFLTPVTSMAALSSLESVGYLDISYSLLANFAGLEKLTSMQFLSLVFNDELTSLNGLHNVAISPILDDYYIFSNSKLSDCAIKYICRGTPDRPGTIGSEIGANATGCNNAAEVAASCEESGLPVRLVSFDARKNDQNKVQLNWVTTSETNSKHFQIERSKEGKIWEILDVVTAQGESNSTLMYSYMDGMPTGNTNFYRLKMVDLDDTFAYSKIVNVTFNGSSVSGVFPNPVTEKFQLGTADLLNLQSIEIYDFEGKIIHKPSVENREINVKHLPPGQYVIRLKKAGGAVLGYRFLKQ